MYYRQTEQSLHIGQQLLTYARQAFAPLAHDVAESAITLHFFPRSNSADGIGGLEGYSWQGERAFYPASVVKVAYLAAAQAALSTGKLVAHAELKRAMTDMILWSSNNATNYVIDILSGTTGDTLLTEHEMKQWLERRQGVNRFFQDLDWPEADNINVCQKLMDDDRYGREKIFVTLDGKNNHNQLNSDFVARLLSEICTGAFLDPSISSDAAAFLERQLSPQFKSLPHSQVDGFLGERLPEGLPYYSKAGWNGWTGDALSSYNRHDSAHFVLPENHCRAYRAITIVVFSHGKTVSEDTGFLPRIGEALFNLLAQH